MQPVLLFDVNESLLDLGGLKAQFEHHFGGEIAVHEWFDQLIQNAMLSVILGWPHNFAEVGRSSLEMVVKKHCRTLSNDTISEIVGGMRRLPAHGEVPEALNRLKSAGFRMAAVTNSPVSVAEEQLTHAGLIQFFEKVISVEEVKTLKPDPKVYRYAAQSMGVEPSHCYLIACHPWDVAGAMAIGCLGGLIKRAGVSEIPFAMAPTVTADDLVGVATKIIEQSKKA